MTIQISSRIASRLLAGFGLAALVGASALVSSRPAQGTGGPVPVQVIGTASVSQSDLGARQPFGMRLYPSIATPATFTVPAGKRLVIQDVAAFNYGGTAKDVAIYTVVNGVSSGRVIPYNVTVGGTLYATASLTDYADPGTTVSVAVDDNNSSDTAGVNVDIHGYYVNIP